MDALTDNYFYRRGYEDAKRELSKSNPNVVQMEIIITLHQCKLVLDDLPDKKYVLSNIDRCLNYLPKIDIGD